MLEFRRGNVRLVYLLHLKHTLWHLITQTDPQLLRSDDNHHYGWIPGGVTGITSLEEMVEEAVKAADEKLKLWL